MKIAQIEASEIFDARGFPTLACTVTLENGQKTKASVPTGISCSSYEVVQLRDDQSPRLFGQGVLKAIEMIANDIAPMFVGKNPDVVRADALMIEKDGTQNKARLGGNSMLAVSMAIARAQALTENLELFELVAQLYGVQQVSLPFPWFNMINGGAHVQNGLRIQEFLVMPLGAKNFREALELGSVFFHTLRTVLEGHKKLPTTGLEGGFSPIFKHDIEAFDMLMEVIETLGGENIFKIGIDVAASQFYDKKNKTYNWNGKVFSSDELIGLYHDLVEQYAICSIEDGLSEHDIEGWERMTAYFQEKIQVVGDDVFATHAERIMQGSTQQIANAVIIKPNQVGTITETLQAVQVAHDAEYGVIVSHRSGETNDTFIADLAVGVGAGQIKAGGFSRGERIAKYNRLLCIEDSLFSNALNIE